jgi:hypothetical protein
MISRLSPEGDTHWLTGTAAPCTSVFKPVWMDAGLPDLGPQPGGTYDGETLWWRHENLHREILRDYATRIKVLRPKRTALEDRFLADYPSPALTNVDERLAFTRACFAEADQMEAGALAAVAAMPVEHRRPALDRHAWRGFDRRAGRK